MVRFNIVHILICLFIIILIVFELNIKMENRIFTSKIIKHSDNCSAYILDISTERINKLFDILHEKEKLYGEILVSLDLLIFENLISGENEKTVFKNFSSEKNRYLKVVDNRIRATEEFVEYLYNVSSIYSPRYLQKHVKRVKMTDDLPVIVTASDSKYYGALQTTIFHLHKHLPGYEIIVYDLGLSDYEYKMTVDNCKCKVIKFNPYYRKFSKHMSNLKTYAWKPIVIQEALKSYKSVLFIDSSVKIVSNRIASQLTTLRKTSMLAHFFPLKLNCYTNPLMYEWFGETNETYNKFYTIETNVLLFKRNFLSALLMKAWVTCALDQDCIAPPGSKLWPCCGCHRYDQNALTVVSSFFYGYPKEVDTKFPAFAFTLPETFFFYIKRLEAISYFTPRVNISY